MVAPSTASPLPFSHKKRKDLADTKFNKFMKVLWSLHNNISFTDALSEMPAYAKYLKEVLAKKRSIPELFDECNQLSLSSKCSALIHNKLPEKLSDPGKFSITIGLGNHRYKVVCDLGASISLIPLSIWKDINMGDLKPIKMRLYMPDGSCAQPTGNLEDIPVQVGKFFVPNDLMVMDINADVQVAIILGRPFLTTAGARIDVKEGLLNLTIGDEEMEFQFNKTMKGSSTEGMVEMVLKVDKVNEVLKEVGASEAVPQVFVEEYVEKEEVKYPLGFLPRPNAHNVFSNGEDDYIFWDLLFDKGRKKERERWRSLKARMEDSGGTEPESEDRMKMNKGQPGVETNVSCAIRDSG